MTNHYSLSIYEIPSERTTYILWFSNTVESLLSSMLVGKLFTIIQFDVCILFVAIPFPNRTTLLYSTDTLFRLNEGSSLSELNTIPVLPSPSYVTGLVAEFFTKVSTVTFCYLVLYSQESSVCAFQLS